MPPPLRFLSPRANRLHPAIIARSPAGARARARAAGDRQQERRNTTLEKERRNTTASSNKKNNVFLPAYLVTSTSRLLHGRVGSICNGHCPTAPTVCSHSHTPEAQISETENGCVPVVTADTCTDPQQRRDHCTGKEKVAPFPVANQLPPLAACHARSSFDPPPCCAHRHTVGNHRSLF